LDFFGLPSLSLIEAVRIGIGWVSRTIEPIEIRFFVGNPFLDGSPGRLDGLETLDVEGWWRRAWKLAERFKGHPHIQVTTKDQSKLLLISKHRPKTCLPSANKAPVRGLTSATEIARCQSLRIWFPFDALGEGTPG